MKHHEFKTKDTCATLISFDKADDGTITNIQFTGGCNGNLKIISKLLDGMKAEEISEKLKGNLCGRRPTSCADQLAIAVMK
ncbi:MAG: TIGR03905 family TSCPD domain-containing protein [Treponema sp.]|nr:TIGR03905 family TSCPD domain-containing protein [Treponema sp.]